MSAGIVLASYVDLQRLGSLFAAASMAGEDDLEQLSARLAAGTSWVALRVPRQLLRSVTMSLRSDSWLQIALDGDPRVCWKRSHGGERVLAACGEARGMHFETQAEAASLLESAYCSLDMTLADCLGAIEAAPPDVSGYYDLP